MKKRVIISSMQSLIQLLTQNESLYQVSVFAPLKEAIEKSSKNISGATCSPCEKNRILKTYRPAFDAALTSLQQADKDQIKQILSVDEVCYYTKNEQGAMVLNCG